MTLQQIRRRVAEGADARFGETMEKVMTNLRNWHTHRCGQTDCTCEYCLFITGSYVNAKLHLHQLKKRLRKYEYHSFLTEGEMCGMMSAEMILGHQKERVRFLKQHKQALKLNVI